MVLTSGVYGDADLRGHYMEMFSINVHSRMCNVCVQCVTLCGPAVIDNSVRRVGLKGDLIYRGAGGIRLLPPQLGGMGEHCKSP